MSEMNYTLNGESTNLTGSITLTKASGTAVTFDTQGQYLEKDISLTLNAQTGSAATPSDITITSNPTISFNNEDKLVASYSGSQSITPTVSAGWVDSGTAATVNTTGTTAVESLTIPSGNSFNINMGASSSADNKVLNVNNANYRTISVNNNNATNSTISVTAKENANDSAVTHNVVTNGYWNVGSATTPATTIYATPSISVDGSGLITVTVSGSENITPTVNEGYISSGTQGTVTVVTNTTNDANTSQLSTQAAQTITPGTTDQTIAAGKFLTGIQTIKGDSNLIAANIADGVTIFGIEGEHTGGVDISDTTAIAADVLSGKDFYLSDGTKTAGTMPYASITSGTATINSATFTYNSTSEKFNLTGSANVSAPVVDTNGAGYISDSNGTKNGVTGGATLSAEVNKIGIASTNTCTTPVVTPEISKTAFTITDVIDAASGNAITTAPSSGVYVAVQSAANKGNLVSTPSVSSAGYGTTTADEYSVTTATTEVGANASAVTYIPIQTGAVSASVNVSGGSASISETGFTASSSATDYYVTLSTSAGSATPTASVTTDGFVTSADNDTQSATTVPVSGDDDVLYIPAGSASSSFSNTGLSTYFDDATSASYNVSIIPQHNIDTAGYIPTTSSGNGTTSYYNIKTTSITQGTTSVSNNIVTRGEASWGTGWITSDSIPAAAFNNAPTTGKTASSYVTIDDDAPVLSSGDYLYIDKGYVDDVKISLAKLVPNGSDVSGHSDYILSGHSAYDNDGVLVAGGIQTLTSSNISISGQNVVIGKELYTGATNFSYSIPGVTLGNSSTFSITVPDGASTVTFVFTVDSSGNTTVSES